MTNVFVISAPSGSGKSTLVSKARELVPGLHFSVSYTTRAPRGKERNGREYYFISRQEFEEMIRKDEFLEYAEVFGTGTDYYGTARRFLREAEQKRDDLLLDIDVQGAAQIKSKISEATSIFILPPDRKELEKRLRVRGLDSAEVIQRRLANASREIENYSKYDYILVNDCLPDSIDALTSILLAERLQRSGVERSADGTKIMERAERCRLRNMEERLQPILASFRLSRR
ncbi:MAG: guanylate kinase [Acidobacteria bacterium]|nr:MAG: guanylate kinase [Acidobacteriota bacterium]